MDDIYTKEGLQPKILDQAAVSATQAQNLKFVEQLLGSFPKVTGVPIAQALTYDLIQIVNRLAIQPGQ